MSREYALQPFREPLHLQINYERELNPQQFAAVSAPPGPALVIAGAGSGKTRTLIYRVAFLLEQGIPPERILLLTFTNKAAKEMMRRVTDLLGQELATLWGGTFHSIGNRVLRQHGPLLGYQRDFSILDREDAKHLLDTCLSERGLDTKAGGFPKPDVLGEIFSLAVNTHRTIADIVDTQHDHLKPLTEEIAAVQKAYTARKLAANAMDFDDLLVLWLKLIQEQPDARELYQRRFQFILVDEYQDTNKLQGDLIDLLAARHSNVMVVGDDAQSIYAWRGANYQNILEFPKRYPDAKIYKIETNYRSTPEILEVANAAIKANVHQFPKQLAASRRSGTKPGLVVCLDGSEQALFVAQRVQALCEEGVHPNKIAVLYRSHFHAMELQMHLTRQHIPFTITSGIRFFEQAHIKDVAAYLKLVATPKDELAFKRLVQLLPGIARKGADKLWLAYAKSAAHAPGAGTKQVIASGDDIAEDAIVARALQRCAGAVPKKTYADWTQLVETMAQLEDKQVCNNPSIMVTLVLEAGYELYLEESYPNYRSRLEDLTQLADFARQFSNVHDFLTQLALYTNLEGEDEQPAANDEDNIRLSTVHQAKGLEFDVVFIIMLCDGLFPSKRSLELGNADSVEEERRLLYVAITRARNELYLCHPLMRGFSSGGDMGQTPSRFLAEIPKELLEEYTFSLGWPRQN